MLDTIALQKFSLFYKILSSFLCLWNAGKISSDRQADLARSLLLSIWNGNPEDQESVKLCSSARVLSLRSQQMVHPHSFAWHMKSWRMWSVISAASSQMLVALCLRACEITFLLGKYHVDSWEIIECRPNEGRALRYQGKSRRKCQLVTVEEKEKKREQKETGGPKK